MEPTMFLVFILGPVVLLVLVFLVKRGRRARNAVLRITPLGGYDTGVRSAYRTPGRWFRPSRTL
jgi:hypothetical protein